MNTAWVLVMIIGGQTSQSGMSIAVLPSRFTTQAQCELQGQHFRKEAAYSNRVPSFACLEVPR